MSEENVNMEDQGDSVVNGKKSVSPELNSKFQSQNVTPDAALPETAELKTESRTETPIPQPAVIESSNKRIKIPDTMTIHEVVGGSSIRRWINEHITPGVQEGIRKVANEKPEDPLRVLGEFLISKSEELKKEGENN